MKRKTVQTAVFALMFPVMAVLAACSSRNGAAEPVPETASGTSSAPETLNGVEAVTEAATEPETGRQDGECFISVYDDPEAPWNYLEVTFSAEDAETVSASIGEALSKDYDIIRESCPLDHAEGFGRRFAYLANTFAVIDRQAE